MKPTVEKTQILINTVLPVTQNLCQWQWQERKLLAARIKPPVGMNDKLSHVIWNFSLCFALGEQEGTAEKGDRWEWEPRPLSRVLTTSRKRRSYRPHLPCSTTSPCPGWCSSPAPFILGLRLSSVIAY